MLGASRYNGNVDNTNIIKYHISKMRKLGIIIRKGIVSEGTADY